MRLILGLVFILSLPSLAMAQAPSCSTAKWGAPFCIDAAKFEDDLCQALLTASTRHGLNTNFFTRLIWQESRFNPNARSHANAQGIAQFIPSTAKIRGLSDPWNPAEALDESARYLAVMVQRYGNEGMAAAAYNGGEGRITRYLDRKINLPSETWNYVQIITNTDAKTWRDNPPADRSFTLTQGQDFIPACLAMAKDRIYTKYKDARPQYKAWGVQLAAGASRSKARASFRRRAAQCKNAMRGKSISYIYKRSPARGRKGLYNARVEFNSRAAAAGFCARLKRSGCVCAVYKN